jgi:hypothetical protein
MHVNFAQITSKKHSQCSMKKLQWAVRFEVQLLFHEDEQSKAENVKGGAGQKKGLFCIFWSLVCDFEVSWPLRRGCWAVGCTTTTAVLLLVGSLKGRRVREMRGNTAML